MRWVWWMVVSIGIAMPVHGDDWQPVNEPEARTLHTIAEHALEGLLEQSKQGWCRAKVIDRTDELQFSFWWHKDRTGLEIETILPLAERDPKLREPDRKLTIDLPTEQWVYYPDQKKCTGLHTRWAQRLRQEMDLHPHRFWLTMLSGQSSKFAHLNRLRAARAEGEQLEVARNAAGHIRFQTLEMRLVFDPNRDFSPIIAEFQTQLDRFPHSDKLLPIREEYDIAQDRHGAWYCRQVTHLRWPRGGLGDPIIFRSAEVLEYDSQPSKELLRLSFEQLDLPEGVLVSSVVPSRAGTWIVGREAEGRKAIAEERFRDLGNTLKKRGLGMDSPQ